MKRRLLLDTHVFLWYVTQNPRLPVDQLDAIDDMMSHVAVSQVSLWECAIKFQLGKLPLPTGGIQHLIDQIKRCRITLLKISNPDILRLMTLPKLHGDPFDRMLIAQALNGGWTLVTQDQKILAYPVPVFV